MGVDNMVRMVKITATPSVLEEMRNSFVMEATLKDERYDWQNHRANEENENENDKEQTHDMANRFRNRASLFVLATWTLGNHVAPDQKVFCLRLLKVIFMMR